MTKKLFALTTLLCVAACGKSSPPSEKPADLETQEHLRFSGRWKVESYRCHTTDRLPKNLEVDFNNGLVALIGTSEETETTVCRHAIAFLRTAREISETNAKKYEIGSLSYGRDRTVCKPKSSDGPGQSDSISQRPQENVSYEMTMNVANKTIGLNMTGLFECTDLSLNLRK